MKKVLMIACSFPPLGGPGVQRSVKFVKYLRDYGYEPVVFTRECKNETVIDKTLLNDVPEGVRIVRTKDYMCDNMKGIFRIPGKVLSRLMIPDYAAIWWKMVKREALKVIEEEKIDLIYSTSAPCSDHLLALYLKKKKPNLKWVADFRDEWTQNPYFAEDKLYKFKKGTEVRMEKDVLDHVDYAIANTPVMRDHFVSADPKLKDKFFVIPNGFDKDDFDSSVSATGERNEKMTMVYTGALYGRRKPDTFFKALEELVSEKVIDSKNVEVKLIGNYHVEQLEKKIASYQLSDVIHIVGYLPHDKCVASQMASDALVLIEGNGKGAEAFYTGKLFEYLNTNKPVLAMLPYKGVAAELVRESNVGLVADVDDVAAIKTNIATFYQQWMAGGIEYKPNREVIDQFDRKKLTGKLAQIFDLLK